jgi:hypothetical protein
VRAGDCGVQTDKPKARWCRRTSKQSRRARERILDKARQLRVEMGLEPAPELEA